ncbi:MAG: protein kinase [Streptosporangiaceae bacterium]
METGSWAVPVPLGYEVRGWVVERPLATGSWGSVYAVCRDGTERAAVKFLPTGTVSPRQLNHLAAMAGREVRSHSELVHPRLIGLTETFTLDDPDSPGLDGATVIVMELAERAVAELVAPGRQVPGAAGIITQICEGLAHMHAEGWLHGDLKPSNVLLMADGSVRLADFGLTTELDGTHAYLPRAGSLDYLAPERREEKLTDKGIAVRASADIWALGITACEILTGCLPFPGGTWRARAAAAADYVEGRAPLVLDPRLPDGWRDWITDCLAPTHAARGRHSAASLLARARDLTAGRSLHRWSWRRWSRRRRIAVTAGAAVVAVTAGIGVPVATAPPADPTGRWLRTDSDVPREYRQTIVQAATRYCLNPLITPALVAAMLKAESGFDPNLSDPANTEYGIARWTPSVLQYYLPAGQIGIVLSPPLDPQESIRALGRFLCKWAPDLEARHVPGDHRLSLAAAYRSSVDSVVKAGGVPPRWRPYTTRVRTYLDDYRPR